MIAPVPSHIDEADQGAIAQASRDPAQAVWSNLIPPPCYSVATMCLDERHHFRVRDGAAPAVLDRLGHAQHRASGGSAVPAAGPISRTNPVPDGQSRLSRSAR